MTSILDIDLDYFAILDDPLGRLDRLLAWANRPIDCLVDHHHKSFDYWVHVVRQKSLPTPRFILHVDEHHDMLGEMQPISFGNFLFFAMRRWPQCCVHWQVEEPIDSPAMWLSDEAWEAIAGRFTVGPHRKPGWPHPDIVTVYTSPGFLDKALAQQLLERMQDFHRRHNPRAPLCKSER